MRRIALAVMTVRLALGHACSSAGFLVAPASPGAAPAACAASPDQDPLVTCAPLVLQATYPETSRLDHPTGLDPDSSQRLDDDLRNASPHPPARPVPLYAAARADATHHYLFYALYYVVDWSGPPRAPRIDHVADFEGLLVVVSRATGRVEAAITQAHRLFYLWKPGTEANDAPCSGQLALTDDGRPIVFAEAGGHGIYAMGAGPFRPQGGSAFPHGPAEVPARRLLAITTSACDLVPPSTTCVAATVEPLARIYAYTAGERGPFRDLPRGALPPWLWRDRRGRDGGLQGAIVLDPAALYENLARAERP